MHANHLLFYFMWSKIFILTMIDVRKFFLSSLNIWSVWFVFISQELSINIKQTNFPFIFLVIFIFLWVPWLTSAKSHIMKIYSPKKILKRSMTYIKTQVYLHPREVFISFLTDSRINGFSIPHCSLIVGKCVHNC